MTEPSEARGGREIGADVFVFAILAGCALLILVLLPSDVAGGVVGGLAAVIALAAVAAVLLRSGILDGGRPGLGNGALDPLWAALAVAALLFILGSGMSLGDGKGVVLVGGTTVIGSWFAYRRRLEDRRRSVAVALAAEIRVNAEATWHGLAPEVMEVLAAKPAGFKPYVVPVPAEYPAYGGNQDTLGLLPAAAVQNVVRFYETDEFMTQAYNALGSCGFHAIDRDRQNQLYAHITERMRSDYLPAARAALVELAKVVGEEPVLPPFLEEPAILEKPG